MSVLECCLRSARVAEQRAEQGERNAEERLEFVNERNRQNESRAEQAEREVVMLRSDLDKTCGELQTAKDNFQNFLDELEERVKEILND